MTDAQQQVQTVFRVNQGTAVSALRSVGSAAQQVGAQILHATASAGRMASSLGAALSPLRALVAGALGVGGVRALIQMHSEAEGMRQAIAGTLTAFGATRNFGEGLQVTAGLMDQINRDAAALPGSAEDYAHTFRTALPAAMSAGFHSLSEIATFTNHMTAVAVANQEDSEQAGMDIMRLLQGQAGAHVRLWHTLAPLVGKTAQQFNALTAPQRAQAMQGALARYAPLLAEMGNTWDAIFGTTSQYVVQLTRAATSPIFDSVKEAFQHLNEWIERNYDSVLHLGQAISRHIVGVFDPLNGRISELVHRLDVVNRMRGFASNVLSHAAPMVAAARERLGTMGEGGGMGPLLSIAARVVFGPIGGIVAFFATHMSVLTQVMDALQPAVAPLIGIFSTFGDIVGNAVATLLPPLAGLVSTVLPPLEGALNALAVPLHDLFQATGHLITALGPVLVGVIDILSASLQGWMPVITALVRATTAVVEYFNRLAGHAETLVGSALGGATRAFSGFGSAPTAAQIAASTPTSPPVNMQGHALPAARGGSHTVNDFRYSRFDITQRFAEGMDPDRVAVAFTHHLERQADQRLQGHLEPAFTQR